jgi:protein O-mannosyl-transferase
MLSAEHPRLKTCLVALGLFCATVALFSRGTEYGFTTYDDPIYVTNNVHVQEGLTWSSVRWAFTGAADYWHPLSWLSHMLDWQLFEDRAQGHHATSVLWHAANAVLAFLLVRRITAGFWGAALCAALFALHPLRVESVTWITERKDLISGFFFLATLYAYLEYAEGRRRGLPSTGRYATTLGLFLLSLMSKPVMVTLPGVLLLLDYWPLRRATIERERPRKALPPPAWLLIEKVPFFVLSLVIALVTVRMQQEHGAFTLHLTTTERIANAFVSIPRYLGKTVFPFDLAICYPHPGRWPGTHVAAAIALVFALTVGVICVRRTQPALLVGWGWFLLMLLPSIGLIQVGVQAMADRYTYIASLGLFLPLGAITVSPSTRVRLAAAALATAVLGGLAGRTWSQQGFWRDSLTLFTHAAEVTPDNYLAHTFLALAYRESGDMARAAVHAERAVSIKPDYATALDAYGVVQRDLGNRDAAKQAFERVLQLAPKTPQTEVDLGLLLLQEGDLESANAHFQRVAAYRPDFAPAWAGLARVNTARREYPQAIKNYGHALELAPQDVSSINNLATVYAAMGDFTRAESLFRQAIQAVPNAPESHANFAEMLRQTGRLSEAFAESAEAVRLDPGNPAFHAGALRIAQQLDRPDDAFALLESAAASQPNNVPLLLLFGDVLGQRGDVPQATRVYEDAVRQAPHNADAHARLGFALYMQQQPRAALQHWEEALRLKPDFPGLSERVQEVRSLLGGR